MKRCSGCGEAKRLDGFDKNRSQADGLDPYCKPCRRAYTAEWRKRNPERKRERDRRQNAKPSTRRRKTRWDRERGRKPCPNCSSLFYAQKGANRCRDCYLAERKAITAEMLKLRRQGLLNYEIAERLETTIPAVASALMRRHVEAWGLEWLPSPYYSGEWKQAA